MNFDKYGNVKFVSNSKSLKFFDLKFEPKIDFKRIINKISPKTIISKRNMIKIIFSQNNRLRNVSVVGNLHHGKSSLINCLIKNVHSLNDECLSNNFLNIMNLEKQKNISISSKVYSLLIFGKKKPHSMTFIDCPGHLDFYDETLNSIILSECAILVIDCHDGILIGSEIYLRTCFYTKTPIIILINAIDRLIFELKLSPIEVQKRILQILDELNLLIAQKIKKKSFFYRNKINFFNPLDDNVCFASLSQGWIFNLSQFSELYIASQPSICLSQKDLSEKIWNGEKIEFVKENNKSLFVTYVIEPLFKIIIFCGLESFEHIRKFIEVDLGFYGIRNIDYLKSKEELISLCLSLFLSGCKNNRMFSNHSAILNSINKNSNSHFKIFKKKNSNLNLNKSDHLAIILKANYEFIQKKNCFLAKIINGKFDKNTKLIVLSEKHFIYYDQRTIKVFAIDFFFLPIGRYCLGLNCCPRGLLVIFNKSNIYLKKSALITDLKSYNNSKIFYSSLKKNLDRFGVFNSFYLTIKLDLIKNFEFLIKSLRTLSQSYFDLNINLKKSGEVTVKSGGNLYLECLIYDLNQYFEDFNLTVKNIQLIKYNSIYLKSNSRKFKLANGIEIIIGKLRKIIRSGNLNQLNFQLNTKNNDFRLKSGYTTSSFQNNTKLGSSECNSVWNINFSNVKHEPIIVSGSLMNSSIIKKTILEIFSNDCFNESTKKSIVGIEIFIKELNSRNFVSQNKYFFKKEFQNNLNKFMINKIKNLNKNCLFEKIFFNISLEILLSFFKKTNIKIFHVKIISENFIFIKGKCKMKQINYINWISRNFHAWNKTLNCFIED